MLSGFETLLELPGELHGRTDRVGLGRLRTTVLTLARQPRAGRWAAAEGRRRPGGETHARTERHSRFSRPRHLSVVTVHPLERLRAA